MGLVVDEIVDIVEQRLDIEVASERPGVLGYAVVEGQAPPRSSMLAIFCRKPSPTGSAGGDARSVAARAPAMLLVDDSAFFRDMLAPLIKAAGYQVTRRWRRPHMRSSAIKSGTPFDIVVTDIEMPEHGRLRICGGVARKSEHCCNARSSPCRPWFPPTPSSAGATSASTISSPSSIAAGLIAAIKEQTDDLHQAA